ncbi:MAG: hypothetical protein KGD64_06240, partial [Candidatus Heimdallarchaeota archaeon]|nr:hypothetical protein [Candidatus Heimdallarchaeota archaeon]
MSKIGSLFNKKKRKEKEEQPNFFNGLYQFNHKDILKNSQLSETVLVGNEKSETLYLDSTTNPSSFCYVFAGKKGTKVLSEMKTRIKENFPSSLIISSLENY